MNKFLTLVFLGLLLIILRLSTQNTRRDVTARPVAPANYAGPFVAARPDSSRTLNRPSAGSQLLVATER